MLFVSISRRGARATENVAVYADSLPDIAGGPMSELPSRNMASRTHRLPTDASF